MQPVPVVSLPMNGLRRSACVIVSNALVLLLSREGARSSPSTSEKGRTPKDRTPRVTSQVYSWGSSQFGETGHGFEVNNGISLPRRIEALDGVRIAEVHASSSGTSSGVRSSDGKVYTFGNAKDGRLGFGSSQIQNQTTPRHLECPPDDITDAVSLGEFFGLWIRTGRLHSFGRRAHGQWGAGNDKNGTTNSSSSSATIVLPGPVGGALSSLEEGLVPAVLQASAGREHALAVTVDGAVYSWGCGSTYALGSGEKMDLPVPVRIDALKDVPIAQVSAGREHSLFLSTSGQVYSCGSDFFGQTGGAFGSAFTKKPTPVLGLIEGKRVRQVAAGEYTSFALGEDGEVYCWGSSRLGTLGLGDRNDVGSPRHLRWESLGAARIVKIAAGGGHTLFLTDTGKVFATGCGKNGQLGRGDVTESVAASRFIPLEVTALSAIIDASHGRKRIIDIAAGRDHSLAVIEETV